MISLRLFCVLASLLLLSPAQAESHAASAEKRGVVLLAWNLQNYAPLPDSDHPKAPKSAASADAIATIIARQAPDILTFCEMGNAAQLADLRERLLAHGLEYPYTELLLAADPHRHLALLSRYPIASRQSLDNVALEINGELEKMRRGILDVTLTPPDGTPLRIVGVHLKSKLELRNENEALLRRSEAHRLRKHLDQILTAEPNTRLLLYGDFNDTRDQPVLREIAGTRGAPLALQPLPLADERGDRWTHHWATADLYARIDFIMISHALRKKVDSHLSHIDHSPEWREASDHRPLIVVFKPGAL